MYYSTALYMYTFMVYIIIYDCSSVHKYLHIEYRISMTVVECSQVPPYRMTTLSYAACKQ